MFSTQEASAPEKGHLGSQYWWPPVTTQFDGLVLHSYLVNIGTSLWLLLHVHLVAFADMYIGGGHIQTSIIIF